MVDALVNWTHNVCWGVHSPPPEAEYEVRWIALARVEVPVLIKKPFRYESLWFGKYLRIASETPST